MGIADGEPSSVTWSGPAARGKRCRLIEGDVFSIIHLVERRTGWHLASAASLTHVNAANTANAANLSPLDEPPQRRLSAAANATSSHLDDTLEASTIETARVARRCPVDHSSTDARQSHMSGPPHRMIQGPHFASLSAEATRAIERCAVGRTFAAGDHLLTGGDRAEWLHVLEKGLVREFYVTPDGNEHTRVFVSAGGVTGSLLDLSSGGPSVTWIQALERTRTLALRFADFNALAAEHGDVASLARRYAEALAIRKTEREYEMLALSATERLARWRADHPGLDGRITRRLLASYLGITPVHLSRISSKAVTEGRRGRARPRR